MANDEVRPYSLCAFRTVLRDNYYLTLTCVLKEGDNTDMNVKKAVTREGVIKNLIRLFIFMLVMLSYIRTIRIILIPKVAISLMTVGNLLFLKIFIMETFSQK